MANPILLSIFASIGVFVVCYLNIQKILEYLYKSSLGNREEILKMIELMFIPISKKQLTTFMVIGSFGMGLLIFFLLWPNIIFGFILGSIVTLLGWKVPKILFKSIMEKRNARVTNQMLDGGVIMGNGIKAGLSVPQSMDRVIKNIPGPLSQEFNLILNKNRLGMPLEQSLEEFSERVPTSDIQMFTTSINILKETGGNLGVTFETIVETIRDRQKIEKEIQALTAQGLVQGRILTAIPFVLMGIIGGINPSFMKPLFVTPVGWGLLILIIILVSIGAVMIKKIVNIKV
ncbi:MAG: hypothetical protein HAW60_00975 [Bdellovibrionales bacterium]|nr:hypothetical protein [Bdellovibrionales bacterium]